MNNAAHKIEKEVTFNSLVIEAMEELDGDVKKASDRVFYLLKSDQKLLRTVIDAAVGYAVFNRSQDKLRHTRQHLIKAVTRDRVVALAEGMISCLLDMPLAGGLKLRDASRFDVLEQVQRYTKQANNMSHKARWLQLVAQSVPDDRTVGEVLQESRVKELYEESKNAN